MRLALLAVPSILACMSAQATAQGTCSARMEQDPSLNNLVHPAGYEAAAPGTLGRVEKSGSGDSSLILIAGAGFGADVFDEFIADWQSGFTFYKVTLAGSGGTAAPPMPDPAVSYADGTWVRYARDGVLKLIADESLTRPVILAHWLFATNVALRLALDEPDRIGGVVIVSGVARFESADPASFPGPATPEERVEYVDTLLAPLWFRTVTAGTWHDNNFLPADYAINPLRQLRLWQQAAEPTIPTWVRYLCEVWATDVTTELGQLRVPTLVVKPGFDECFRGSTGYAYMSAMTDRSWQDVPADTDAISFVTIEDARAFIMHDQPDALRATIEGFLQSRNLHLPTATDR